MKLPQSFYFFLYPFKRLFRTKSYIFSSVRANHKALVFSLLRHKPEILLNFSIIRREVVNEFSEPFNIGVVSSAYWLILIWLLFIEIPVTSLFCLMAFARISTDRINKYGERGQPCLTPLSGLK